VAVEHADDQLEKTMTIPIKLRAGNGEIKTLITHPSENGLRKDGKTGQLVPAHFISSVIVTLDGKTVLDGQWGGGVSKDPYLSFKVKGMKAGATVRLSVKDNQGDSGSAEAVAS
jgi:sulfur-oxidizing protein SoxZ